MRSLMEIDTEPSAGKRIQETGQLLFSFSTLLLFFSSNPRCPNTDPQTSPLCRTSPQRTTERLRSASGATARRRALIKVVQTEVCTKWVGHQGRQEKGAGLPTLSPAAACLDKTPGTCGGISMRHRTWRKRQLNPAPRTTGPGSTKSSRHLEWI